MAQPCYYWNFDAFCESLHLDLFWFPKIGFCFSLLASNFFTNMDLFWCLLWIPPCGLILIPKHGVLFQCFFIELLSLFPLHSVNFEGLDMFQFNTELVSWWLLACLLQISLQKKKKKNCPLETSQNQSVIPLKVFKDMWISKQTSHKLGRKGEVGILSSQANGGVHVTIASVRFSFCFFN
jgi:hypothetical protein